MRKIIYWFKSRQNEEKRKKKHLSKEVDKMCSKLMKSLNSQGRQYEWVMGVEIAKILANEMYVVTRNTVESMYIFRGFPVKISYNKGYEYGIALEAHNNDN